MAIKKTELYSSLWASADELRGGMDASEYKNYVLTLLFMKYVSDKQNDPRSLIIVPEGASFKDMVALSGDKEIGDKINKIIGKLAEANGLKGVIDTADFGDETKLGADKQMIDTLSKLVKIFDNLDLGANTAEGDDLLGDAYEYLMRHFATESGKSKGQFYTPSEVSTILPKIIGITKDTPSEATVYDPTCGSGSLLLKASHEAPNGLSIYGQEKEVTTTALCRMNMILHNSADADIAPGGQSTLANPHFKGDDDSTLKTFDFVVANPPFSLKAWTNGVESPDRYSRFDGFVTPPEKNGDYAFLLHILKSMKSKAKGAVILPHGVLFRGNAEGTIREKLIKKGWIKGIIGLPANLFYGTGIPACIIVLDKENAQSRSGIFMIDASKGFKKDGNKNRLRAQDVHKIVDTFNKQLTIDKYSIMVTHKQIIEDNDCNLNIPRYIDSSETEDVQDLYAHLNGGIPLCDIDNLREYWDVFEGLREELFAPSIKEGYATAKIELTQIKSHILRHVRFGEFRENVYALYRSWNHFERFYNLEKGFHPKELIHIISEDLLEKFAEVKLISPYDIYQILMDYWADVMQDDCYMISLEGWEIAQTMRELIPSKGKDGKNVYKEVHDFEFNKVRYSADLIPPKLIINSYFRSEQDEIDVLEGKYDAVVGELENFIEENSGEEGLLEEAKNDKGNINKKSIDARLKETKDEDEIKALKECKKLIDAEAKAKKELKEATDKLSLVVFKKYPTLSIDQIKSLVIDDKWLAHLSREIGEEISRVTSSLANRIKTLEERYNEPLKTIEQQVNELGSKVEEHLKAMGLSW
ncbi:MAG: type I restriction-modification system subunit M [Sulfuricurvum sp.]|nr:type I restriction-modification system subunit M [Sulfuricurvum sp.]